MSPQTGTHPAGEAMAELQAWREWALRLILIATLGTGLFPLLLTLRDALYIPHQRPAALSFLVVYLFIVLLLLAFRHLDYRLRAWGLLLAGYATGVLAMARGGLAGSGRMYLLALPPVAIALVGVRSGIAAALLSLLTHGGFTIAAGRGWPHSWLVHPEGLLTLYVWLYEGVTFVMLLTVVTLLLGLTMWGQAKALAKAERAVAELAAAHRRLLVAREEERKHVAHDLHDSVLQQLFFIKQGLLHDQNHTPLAGLLDEVVQTLRQTIKAQRPPLLDQELSLALQALIEERQKLTGPSPVISWHSDVTSRTGLSDEQATALYRIAQEALTNALKHADAQSITVTLDAEPDGTVGLCIADDGAGMPISAPGTWALEHHHGLADMRERATMINAQLHIASVPGEGTSVAVELIL